MIVTIKTTDTGATVANARYCQLEVTEITQDGKVKVEGPEDCLALFLGSEGYNEEQVVEYLAQK